MLGDATWVAVDEQRPSYRDRADAPVLFERAFTALRATGRYRIVFDEDGIVVLRLREGPSAGAGTP